MGGPSASANPMTAGAGQTEVIADRVHVLIDVADLRHRALHDSGIAFGPQFDQPL